MAILTNDGADQLARILAGRQFRPVPRWLNLYVNDFIVEPDTVRADLTFCTLSGYARFDLFTLSPFIQVVNGVGLFSFPTITFTFDPYVAPVVTIFGYAVTDENDVFVWYGDRRSVPFPVPLAGGTLPVDLGGSGRKKP